MTTANIADTRGSEAVFQHDALLYAGQTDFVDRTASFIRDAVRAGEPILVVVGAAKIALLRSELGKDAEKVQFADMATVGQNPGRIIPAWREFVAQHGAAGRRFRGIGEPIWAGRSSDELVECERHEALLNLAFAGAPAWWLVCPYDTEALSPSVIEEAQRNHPFVLDDGKRRRSGVYRGLPEVAQPFGLPLPEPRGRPEELAFEAGSLASVRSFVSRLAEAYGLDSVRSDDLVFAANELATNSILHGGGKGVIRMWPNRTAVICEVRDEGRIADPLVGRERPSFDQEGGFGLWLANQLCELVQVRSFPTGSVVRLHIARD